MDWGVRKRLCLMGTRFQKWKSRLMILISNLETMIDYILVNNMCKSRVKDVKAERLVNVAI